MIRLFLFAAVCLLSTENLSLAETPDPRLRGLTSLGFLVDGVDDEASKNCGITESTVRDAFMYVASSANFKITTDLRSPHFVVTIITLIQRQPIQCISAVSIQVGYYQQVTLDYGDSLSPWVWVGLWKYEGLYVSHVENHPKRMAAAIEDITKNFVTAWNLANKP